jgi:putative transposase
MLNVSRGSVYYRPASAADLALMRRMDELHLDYPFAGSRMLRDLLTAEGFQVGRRHVATLMKRMGIQAVYRKPNTSKPAPGHKIYPYLLRDLPVTHQVWAITYVPMARGFVYLAAVIDWFSRRVLSWRLSITMEFCVEAVEEALARHGKPEIFNSERQCATGSSAGASSGQPVHQYRLHRPADRQRHRHQHGRPGRMARQCVRGATLAFRQVRGDLPQSLRYRCRGADVARQLLQSLFVDVRC